MPTIATTQKRIALYVVVPALVVYIGLRFFAQYHHVDVYVSRAVPMPKELAEGLHMEEHKINPMVTIESPYDNAPEKMLTSEEIRSLRSAIAWSGAMPVFIDSLSIQSPTRVLARRTTSKALLEYQLVRRGDKWLMESATRSQLGHRAPPKD